MDFGDLRGEHGYGILCFQADPEWAIGRAVNKYDLGGDGPVVAMGLHSLGDSHRLLVVYKHGAAVWDMRYLTSPIITPLVCMLE
jgi:hypothetical protein